MDNLIFKKYILNPDYILKNDFKRILIYSSSQIIYFSENPGFRGIIHPVHAMFLTFFNGERTVIEAITEFSSFSGITKQILIELFDKLSDNEQNIQITYGNDIFQFPKYLLIENDRNLPKKNYKIEDFAISEENFDFKTFRLYSPLDLTIMINTICVTDCIYCYANRENIMNCKIPFDRFKEIIREAKKIQIRDIIITGGELFLYTEWDKLLEELIINGFNPLVSTKKPIGIKDIHKLKRIGLTSIQLSLDSLVSQELSTLLKVDENYIKNISNTIKLLDTNKINIHIHTVLTKINSDIKNIQNLIAFLSNYKSVKIITLTNAGYSIYKSEENYKKIRLLENEFENIKTTIKNWIKKENIDIKIIFSEYLKQREVINKKESKNQLFNAREFCTANKTSLVILPDGKVTICEELYWHPKFIIGDINKQSIENIWNSKEALNLAFVEKESIQEKSNCKKCNDFKTCHEDLGACWKLILLAYGKENWDYPDPRCPEAPITKKVIYN